jgi:hypothetical protein
MLKRKLQDTNTENKKSCIEEIRRDDKYRYLQEKYLELEKEFTEVKKQYYDLLSEFHFITFENQKLQTDNQYLKEKYQQSISPKHNYTVFYIS